MTTVNSSDVKANMNAIETVRAVTKAHLSKEKGWTGRATAGAGVVLATAIDTYCNGVTPATAAGIVTGGIMGYYIGDAADEDARYSDNNKNINLFLAFLSGASSTFTGQNIAHSIMQRMANKEESETEVSLPSEVAEVVNQFGL